MGKGNKQVKSGEQVVINSLPDYARPFYENLMKRGEAESLNQFQPYTGERIAISGDIGDIAASRDTIRNQVVGKGIEGLDEAMGIQRDAVSGVGAAGNQVGNIAGQMGDTAGGIASLRGDVRGASQYDPTNFGQARQFTGAEVDKYMSPYMDAVVGRQKDAAIRDFNRMGASRDAAAVKAGAFGGSRQGVADYLAQEGLQQQLGDIDATGRQQAFEQASKQFGADRAAQMDTMSRQEAANQFAQGQKMAGLGQEAALFGQELGALGQQAGTLGQQANMYGQQAQLGQGIAALGGDKRATDIQDAQLLEGMGKTQLDEQQKQLDIGYGDFLNQQNFNKDQLGFFSNLLQGVPIQPNQTTNMYQPYNPMQQALGAGLTGLSLYRGFQ